MIIRKTASFQQLLIPQQRNRPHVVQPRYYRGKSFFSILFESLNFPFTIQWQCIYSPQPEIIQQLTLSAEITLFVNKYQ